MGFVNTFLFMFFLIIFCNITFSCTRKLDNHEEPRSFIGFGTHTAVEKACACNGTTSCACCQVVHILYTFTSKNLCFNINYQANILNVDLSLDMLVLNSMTVAGNRPFQMCAKIPGVLFSSACVTVTEIRTFPGPAVTVCPRIELSNKKENWNIPFSCSTLLANGTAGMGMVIVMPRPLMPGTPGMMGMMPATPGMGMRPATPGTGMMPGTPARPAMPGMGMMPGTPARPAMPGTPGMGMRPAMPGMGMRPAMPGMGMRPATPGMGMRPATPGMGMMPGAPARPAMPAAPARPVRPAMGGAAIAGMPTASGIVPRITGAAGSPVFVVMMNDNLASALESAMTEVSASEATAEENHESDPESTVDSEIMNRESQTDVPNDDQGSTELNPESTIDSEIMNRESQTDVPNDDEESTELDPESTIDSEITNRESQTDLPNDDEGSTLIVNNGDDHAADVSSDPKQYEQNFEEESTTDTEEKLKTLNRKKRNYDFFDVLHQSNRCERAYRICVTRSKHYIVSNLRNPRQNVQVKNGDCVGNLVKIVHEPNGNLCPQTNWNDNKTPPQVTHPPPEFHDSITYTDDTLGAIVIKDEYNEGSDFHPQNDEYFIPLMTEAKTEIYPSRIPPDVFEELNKSSNDSILV